MNHYWWAMKSRLWCIMKIMLVEISLYWESYLRTIIEISQWFQASYKPRWPQFLEWDNQVRSFLLVPYIFRRLGRVVFPRGTTVGGSQCPHLVLQGDNFSVSAGMAYDSWSSTSSMQMVEYEELGSARHDLVTSLTPRKCDIGNQVKDVCGKSSAPLESVWMWHVTPTLGKDCERNVEGN
jgi:hypothetical protein